MTRHRLYLSLCTLLLVSTVFLLPAPAQAVEKKAIGRICHADIAVLGVNELVAEQIERLSVQKQAEHLKNNIESICSLENNQSQTGYYKANIYYSFGSYIQVEKIYNNFIRNRSAAEKDTKPAAFYEANVWKLLEADGTDFICLPFPLEVAQIYTRLLNKTFYSAQGETGRTKNPVTEQGCPEFSGIFYIPSANNTFYLISLDVTTGDLVYNTDKIVGGEDLSRNELAGFAQSLNLLTAKSVPELIGAGLKIVMGIIGSIALLVLIAAGLLWMTAAGNSDKEKRAMSMIMWGGMGIIIILSSYAIVQFIFENAF